MYPCSIDYFLFIGHFQSNLFQQYVTNIKNECLSNYYVIYIKARLKSKLI